MLIFLALVALTASQVAATSSTLEHARALHERLMQDVQREFQNILVELTNTQTAIQDKGRSVVEKFNRRASQRHAALLNRLNSLKLQAEKNGLNSDACTQAHEKLLIELPQKIANEIDRCVQNHASESETRVYKSVSDAWTVRRQSMGWMDHIERECDGADVHSICVATLASQMFREMNAVPARLRQDLSDSQASIAHVEGSIASCKADRDCLLNPLGEAILSDVAACIRAL